jgi:hypothetical protein
VKYLLDEQLDEVVAEAMAPIAAKSGDEFVHILTMRTQGTRDDEIPVVCREESVQCLVSANVRDFGARKFYYQALLTEGLHVAVLRPGKGKFYEEEQLALLSRSYRRIRSITDTATDPLLFACTPSAVRVRSIDDLIEEFDRGRRLP